MSRAWAKTLARANSHARWLRSQVAAALAMLLCTGPCWAQEKVVLQLNWLHQFQFAGYYAAVEKGFYRESGLDVEFREGGRGIDTLGTLEQDMADYAVCTPNVLARKPVRLPFVMLGVIYQHSPVILLALSRSQINSLSALKGHRLMDRPGNAVIAAMLKHEGVDYAALPRVKHSGDPRDLIDGKADAMLAYSTDESFLLDKLHIPYRTWSPRQFGYDFYGDGFCTTARHVEAHSEQTRAFRAASLKGWKYALGHKEEMVELILARYPTKKSKRGAALRGRPVRSLDTARARGHWQSDARTMAADCQHLS
jgi:ABC-type nitrate/sulfonate/bicarbonate transport system substrate-binding protein